MNEEELLKKFIGKNYEKIMNKPFNFAGLFAQVFYLFYRKMYLFGFLIILLEVLLAILISNIFYLIFCYFIVGLIIGLFVNKVYIGFSKDKIRKIINQDNMCSSNELLKKCYFKGGVSNASLVLSTLFVIFVMPYLLLGYSLRNLIKSRENKCTFHIDSTENIKEKFDIEIPSNFVEAEYSGDFAYNYKYVTDNTKANSSCIINFYKVNNYSNTNEIIDSIKDCYGNNIIKEETIETINDISWTTISLNGRAIDKYAIVSIDDKFYLYNYSIEKDADEKLCNELGEEIFNSIKLKEIEEMHE